MEDARSTNIKNKLRPLAAAPIWSQMTEVYYKELIEIGTGPDRKAAVEFWQHFCVSSGRRSDEGDEARVEGESDKAPSIGQHLENVVDTK